MSRRRQADSDRHFGANNKSQTRVIKLSLSKILQDFLDGDGDGSLNTFHNETFSFGNGVEADIKVCGGGNDDSPYVDAVLFVDGSECDTLNTRDTLEGVYTFHCNDVEYKAIIVSETNSQDYIKSFIKE